VLLAEPEDPKQTANRTQVVQARQVQIEMEEPVVVVVPEEMSVHQITVAMVGLAERQLVVMEEAEELKAMMATLGAMEQQEGMVSLEQLEQLEPMGQ